MYYTPKNECISLQIIKHTYLLKLTMKIVDMSKAVCRNLALNENCFEHFTCLSKILGIHMAGARDYVHERALIDIKYPF